MTRSIVTIACLASLAVPAAAQQARTETDAAVLQGRRALLIHNTRYDHLPQLKENSQIRELSSALSKLGFTVTVKPNVKLGDVEETLSAFAATVPPNGTCLVYYSGYALQSGQNNFLLPTDFNPASDRPVAVLAYSVDYIIDLIRGTNARLKTVAIEAAWTDALAGKSDAQGLAPPTINDPGNATNTVIALSSAQPAKGESLFTGALAASVLKPGFTVARILADVQEQVAAASGGRQVPLHYTGSVASRTYLIPPPPVAPKVEVKVEVKEVERAKRAGDIEYNSKRERYVFVPAGKFMMGCVPSTATECRPDEKPQHEVEITRPFRMGETEVTVASWERFRTANRSFGKKSGQPTHPVTRVSWEEAQAYCEWAGGRLPTEAEWEYAARAGKSDEAFLADRKTARETANFDGTAGSDIFEQVAPVGAFDPNAWNLRDMSGNVWEWAQDFYDPAYFGKSPKADPTGPPSGQFRVARGGSCFSKAEEHLRLSYRKEQRDKGNNVGFRCVLPDINK